MVETRSEHLDLSLTPLDDVFVSVVDGDLDGLIQTLNENPFMDLNKPHRDHYGYTILHFALDRHYGSSEFHDEIVRTLLEFGADPNAVDEFERTPMHIITENGTSSVTDITVMLECDANPNAKNILGRTPLHNAALSSNNFDVIRALKDGGADLSVRDYLGMTPHDIYLKNFNRCSPLLDRAHKT